MCECSLMQGSRLREPVTSTLHSFNNTLQYCSPPHHAAAASPHTQLEHSNIDEQIIALLPNTTALGLSLLLNMYFFTSLFREGFDFFIIVLLYSLQKRIVVNNACLL